MAPLALELLYLIIDHTIENELQHYQHVFAPSINSTLYQILLSCQTFHDYVIKHEKYQQLRLWRLLNRIPRQFTPVEIAVGSKDHFTIVSIDMSTEKMIPTMYQHQRQHQQMNTIETFLVLQETTSSIRSYFAYNDYLVKTKLSISDKWNKRNEKRLRNKNKNKNNQIDTKNDVRHELLMEKKNNKKQQVSRQRKDSIPSIGCSGGFLMMKSSKKNNAKNNSQEILQQQQQQYSQTGNSNNSNGKKYKDQKLQDEKEEDDDDDEEDDDMVAIALFPLDTFVNYIKWYAMYHDASIWLWKRSARYFKGEEINILFQHEFRYILDTTRHALIAWDRPSQNNFRFTDHVLNSNVELFSKLLPTS